jgi:hypothetical protein
MLRGLFQRILDEGLIDNERSYQWLKFLDIKEERENTIMAAQ